MKSTTFFSRRRVKQFGYAAGTVVLLAVIGWFVITSGAFFKSFILPRVGKSLNAEITVADVSLSPFSSVTLHQLAVRSQGAEPLFQANELRARYSLWSILRGNLAADEIFVDAPRIAIVQNADGSSNLDPLLKTQKQAKAPAKKQPTKSSPARVNVKSVSIRNAALVVTTKLAGGGVQTAEITGFNFNLNDLKNGGTAKVNLGGAVSVRTPATPVGPAGTLAGTIKATLQVALDDALRPQTAKADGDFAVSDATGKFADLAAVAMKLSGEMAPTEVKPSSVNVTKNGQTISLIAISGPYDSARREGKLTVSVSSINRQVLNLVGAVAGLDFGNTTIHSTNVVTIADGGQSVSLSGLLQGDSVAFTRGPLATPPLELRSDYNLSFQSNQTLLIQSFTVNGTQAGRSLLRAELSRPMKLDFTSASALDESELKCSVTSLNLRDWSALAGTNLSQGFVSADVGVVSQKAGHKLAVTVTAKATDLSGNLGPLALKQGSLDLSARAGLDDFHKLALSEAKASVSRGSDPLASFQASADADLEATSLKLNGAMEVMPAGVKEFTGQSFSGRPLSANLALDATLTKQVLDLRLCQIGFGPTARAAKNQIAVSGKLDMTRSDAITGAMKIAAESLDLSPYWSAISGSGSARPANLSTAQAPTGDAAPSFMGLQKEPPAVEFPVRDFAIEVRLAQLFVGEAEITNFLATARLDRGRMVLKPVQLSLNGAPVTASADVNLGVPGYQYEFALSAPRVPVAPLVNTFVPARAGQLAGRATATAQLKGAGLTGSGFQKNLVGQFDLATTNLNLSIANVRASALRQIIGVILTIPEGIRNPAQMASRTFGSLGSLITGEPRSGGWNSEITQYPIDVLEIHGKAGGGTIALTQAAVQSLAFHAETAGAIPVAPVLGDSPLSLPVHISMKRSLTDSVGLTPTNAPPGTGFASLPDFVTVKGTVGKPEIEKRFLVLAESMLRVAPALAEKAKEAVKSVGDLIGIGQRGQTNSAATNQSRGQPLDDLRNMFRKQ